MNRKKAFTLIMLIPAVVMILLGIPLTNNYTHQETPASQQTSVFSNSVVVPINETAYIKIDLAASDQPYWQSLTVSNGGVRERDISLKNFSTWTNTSSLLGWNELTQTAPESSIVMGAEIGHGPINYYMVFWNPDSLVDKEVTTQIYYQTTPTTQTVYNYSILALGIALIAGGSIIGIVATLKLGRRVFFTAIALVMILSGAFMAYNNASSNIIHQLSTVATGSIMVPANGYAYEPMQFNATGTYYFGGDRPIDLNDSVDRTIMLNATLMDEASFNAWQNGHYQPQWSVYYYCPVFSSLKSSNLKTTYDFVLTNQNASDAQVYYTIYRQWDQYNYVGVLALVGGVALVPAGAATIYLTNKNKLKQFNKALENQE
jgi:hypothetical protein